MDAKYGFAQILAIAKRMRVIRTIDDLKEGVAALVAQEPRFAAIVREGLPPLRRSPGGFTTLVEIIVEQMISLKAAQAIMNRLHSAFDPIEPKVIHQSSLERLQKLGLSRAKAASVKAIAQAAAKGWLDFNELEQLDDGEVQRRLMSLKGIGPWSADIYLLTALGRRDVWPGGDVALQSAVQLVFELDLRPGAKRMEQLAEPWRPWRAVAARLLWTYYRRVKAMADATNETSRPLHSIATQDIVIYRKGADGPEG